MVFKKQRPAWNKGLTAKTDERMRNLIEKRKAFRESRKYCKCGAIAEYYDGKSYCEKHFKAKILSEIEEEK